MMKAISLIVLQANILFNHEKLKSISSKLRKTKMPILIPFIQQLVLESHDNTVKQLPSIKNK